jgi:3-hydroxyisobutyrate dehydrogenase-like beta-hydroxyacid dehydrogenase
MSEHTPSLIGIIGVGAIGGIMAQHILAAGHELVAWDMRPEALEPIVRAGGRAAKSLGEVGAADTVLNIVFDDHGVEEVTFGSGGLIETMAPGSRHLTLSTISPQLARRLYDGHAQKGQGYLATSMFGRPEAAASAQTMFNCSGQIALYQQVMPLLSLLGTSRWVGPEPEQAMMIKIIGNNMIHAAVETLREMFDFLAAANISMREAKESIIDRLFPGLIYEGYAELLMNELDRPQKTHPMQLKDSRLCIETAKAVGVRLPLMEFMSEMGEHSA